MNALAQVNTDSPAIADDMLEGAAAIAAFLGWSAPQVYHAKRRKGLPIRSLPGIGIYAFKSELTAALKGAGSLP